MLRFSTGILRQSCAVIIMGAFRSEFEGKLKNPLHSILFGEGCQWGPYRSRGQRSVVCAHTEIRTLETTNRGTVRFASILQGTTKLVPFDAFFRRKKISGKLHADRPCGATDSTTTTAVCSIHTCFQNTYVWHRGSVQPWVTALRSGLPCCS